MNSNTQLMTESFFRSSGLAADFAAESRLGIYVHVPFCPHICPYCDFVKTSKFSRADVSAYFSQLVAQFDGLSAQVPADITTVTVYLGGGTPSLFPAACYQPLIRKISSRFRIEEFTVETNPFTNTNKAFSEWTALGATRMTLGAQSLNPDVLQYLGRKHTAEHILKNLSSALAAGFKQVQVDLIFGVKRLASQRLISDEINQLRDCGAAGVSCYLLTIEETTPFSSESTAEDNVVIAEYENIIATCGAAGFIQHETSNFSLSAPVHNRLYWYGLPYLGLGTGAHGLLPPTSEHPFGRRYRVGPSTLRRNLGDDHMPFASDAEQLFTFDFSEDLRSRNDALQELLMTLLRTRNGIPLSWLSSVYEDSSLAALWRDPRMSRALDEGLLVLTDEHLSLIPREKIRGDSWSLLLAGILHPE